MEEAVEQVKNMIDKNLAPMCGLYCGTCEYLGKQCQGCGYQEGKSFWAVQMKVEICPLYDCCIMPLALSDCTTTLTRRATYIAIIGKGVGSEQRLGV